MNWKIILVEIALICILSTSCEELKNNHNIQPGETFRKEKEHLNYIIYQSEGPSLRSENKAISDNGEEKIFEESSHENNKDIIFENTGDYYKVRRRRSDYDPCAPDGDGTKECNELGKECKMSGKWYTCGDCILKNFTENDKKVCVEQCSPGTKRFNLCEKEKRKCEHQMKSPYAKCTDCKDGYIGIKKFLFNENCVEHCSRGSSSEKKCKRLKRKCHVTKKKPFFECQCADNLTEKNGECIEHCVSGTESEKNCTNLNKKCNKISKKPFFKCGECIGKYDKKDDGCAKFCTDGTRSEKICTGLNKVCKTQGSEPYFKCGDCMERYDILDNSCVEYCSNGTASEKKCAEENKICQKTANKPFYHCPECIEGYISRSGKCVQLCATGTKGDTECSNLKRECYVSEKDPFYECGECKEGLTEKGENCVEHCTVGTASESKCSEANRKCLEVEVSPFFKCGECIPVFEEVNNSCITPCSIGTEGEKYCTALNRTCDRIEKHPFYSCGSCKRQFGEKDEKCLDHCTKGLRGHNVCQRQNKHCEVKNDGLFYKCTECISGYILKGGYCENPCDEDEDGWVKCSGLGRACVFNPGEEYKCGGCNNSNWIKDGERCIDPCENIFSDDNNDTWSDVCRKADATCEYSLGKLMCNCKDEETVFKMTAKACINPCVNDSQGYNECDRKNRVCVIKKEDPLYECGDCKGILVPDGNNCIYPCNKKVDGITWYDLCNKTNAECVVNQKEQGATCECKQSGEVFDYRSKMCKGPCDHIFSDDSNDTWSDVCIQANAVCGYNLGKAMCDCTDKKTVFNMTAKACVKRDLCELYQCENNGTCKINEEGDPRCKCTNSWYGNHCEHWNLCEDRSLCPSKCFMNEEFHTYVCECDHDEYFDYERKQCLETACLEKICPDLTECKNGSCVCKHGFEEMNNQEETKCKMTDELCEEKCGMKHVSCMNVSSPTEFTCVCKEGYYFNPNSSSCEDSRCMFPFHPCEHICNIDGEKLCSCFEGFKLVNDSLCEVESENSCKKEDCVNGKCIIKGGSEECICNKGYIKSSEGQCVDVCETNDTTVQSLCPNGCIHKNGMISCICEGKYTKSNDGISCIEKNYCQEGDVGQVQCSNMGKKCVNNREEPWYKCVCPNGLRGDDGEECTDSCSDGMIEECATTYRTCKFIDGSEECVCPLSMTFDDTVKKCQFSNDFFYITIDVSVKQADMHSLYAPTKEDNVHLKRSFYNAMKALYGSSLKEADIIECRGEENVAACTFSMLFAENANGVKNRIKDERSCKQLYTIEHCIFPPDLIVVKKSLETATFSNNKCDQRIKHRFCPDESHMCHSMEPGYSCLCKSGFSPVTSFILGNDLKYKYDACQDINECQDQPCWENSRCENTFGSFLCNCEREYVLNNTKNGCKGVCDEDPCGSNGKCTVFDDHKHKCECSKGYRGASCTEKDENNVNESALMIGAVLGIILLVSISVIIGLTIKLNKGRRDSYELQATHNRSCEYLCLSKLKKDAIKR